MRGEMGPIMRQLTEETIAEAMARCASGEIGNPMEHYEDVRSDPGRCPFEKVAAGNALAQVTVAT